MNITNYSLKSRRYIILSVIILIILWQGVSLAVDNNVLFPSFIDILKALWSIITGKSFMAIILFSILRGVKSFLISIALAIVLAILSYFNKVIYNVIIPILSIIKAVPTMAFIVLLLIWTSKDYAPVIIGIMISLPIFFEAMLNTITNFDKKILHMCSIYRISIADIIREIIIPVIAIELGKVLSSTFSLIFKVVISGEVYAQPAYGIGAIIQLEKMQLNTDKIIAWIIIITIISYIFELLFKVINSKYINKRR